MQTPKASSIIYIASDPLHVSFSSIELEVLYFYLFISCITKRFEVFVFPVLKAVNTKAQGLLVLSKCFVECCHPFKTLVKCGFYLGAVGKEYRHYLPIHCTEQADAVYK